MTLTCSARGCSSPATWSLLWNNPKLHTPDRRKSWLACDEHRTTLGDFLGARGFLRDVEPSAGHRVRRGPQVGQNPQSCARCV